MGGEGGSSGESGGGGMLGGGGGGRGGGGGGVLDLKICGNRLQLKRTNPTRPDAKTVRRFCEKKEPNTVPASSLLRMARQNIVWLI
jgi:hypothetical protein